MQIIGRSVGRRARRRQRLRAEAGRGGEPDRARLRRARRRGRAPGRARSTSCPASARRPARRSPAHPGIDHVSFTGSVAVGRLVQAAAAANVVPVTLELGGKSPQLVFDDADLERRCRSWSTPGIQNAGQTCSAASRILVQRGVYDRVVDGMAARYRRCGSGPALADLDLGPLISARQKAIVEGFLDRGARPRGGGARADRRRCAGRRALLRRRCCFADVPPGPHRWRRRRSSARCRW